MDNNNNENEPTARLSTSSFLASVFGLGFIKFAPGTVCSLIALPLTGLIVVAGGSQGLIIVTLAIFAFGYLVTAIALRHSEDKDPSYIVIDELGAQMSVFIIPVMFFPQLVWFPGLYILGFALFRFFDIVKPGAVGVVDEKLDGALGVMLDDIIAAAYSSIILTLVMWFYYVVIRTQPAIAG